MNDRHALRAQVRVYVGTVATLADGTASAISKSPVPDLCSISPLGLRGDVCADTRHHGGADRALLFYPREHYVSLKHHFSFLAPLSFGCLGENLSGEGLPESRVCIGDIFSLGNAVIEVSQPRSPCFKLGIRCGDREVPRAIQDLGLTGYFFRVLSPGECDPVADLVLQERPEPNLTVAKAGEIYFAKNAIVSDLERLANSPALCQRWKDKVTRRLVSGAADSSIERLYGPASREGMRQTNRKRDDSDLPDDREASLKSVPVDYVPIDCDLHDYLEIAGIKGYPIRVRCTDGADWTIKVNDLVTKADKSEWLIGMEIKCATERRIRLDHIRDITAVIENSDFSSVYFK